MPEQCGKHMRPHFVGQMHERTDGRTNEELLTFCIDSHLSNAQEAGPHA